MTPATKRRAELQELAAYRAKLRSRLEQYHALEIEAAPKQFDSNIAFLNGPTGSRILEIAAHTDISVKTLLEHIDNVRENKCSREEVFLNLSYSCDHNDCSGSGEVEISFLTHELIADPLWTEKMKIWEEEKARAPETKRIAQEANEKKRLVQLKKELATLEKKLGKTEGKK